MATKLRETDNGKLVDAGDDITLRVEVKASMENDDAMEFIQYLIQKGFIVSATSGNQWVIEAWERPVRKTTAPNDTRIK